MGPHPAPTETRRPRGKTSQPFHSFVWPNLSRPPLIPPHLPTSPPPHPLISHTTPWPITDQHTLRNNHFVSLPSPRASILSRTNTSFVAMAGVAVCKSPGPVAQNKAESPIMGWPSEVRQPRVPACNPTQSHTHRRHLSLRTLVSCLEFTQFPRVFV